MSDYFNSNKGDRSNFWINATAVGGTMLVGVATFVGCRYKIARPTEFIVRTGLGIKGVSVTKQGLQWPLQRVSRFDITPQTINVHIDAMSQERIPFKMPAVFTVGPHYQPTADDLAGQPPDSLIRYVSLLLDLSPEELHRLIVGVIEGETRILSATMKLDDLFNKRDAFKEVITGNLNAEFKRLGLWVYNANVNDLADLEDSSYFSEQRKRALQKVAEQARVDVAEAIKEGDTGTKLYERDTRVRLAQLEKEAKLVENDRQRDINQSDATLRIATAEFERDANIAEAESRTTGQREENKMQLTVEVERKARTAENLRAEDFTKTVVEAEQRVRKAEGEAAAVVLAADAQLYLEQQQAEGRKILMAAKATGLIALTDAMGSPETYNKYLVLQGDLLPKIAHSQAEAVRDMRPMIWSTGADGGGSAIADLVRNLPPIADGLGKWTGVDLKKMMRQMLTEEPAKINDKE